MLYEKRVRVKCNHFILGEKVMLMELETPWIRNKLALSRTFALHVPAPICTYIALFLYFFTFFLYTLSRLYGEMSTLSSVSYRIVVQDFLLPIIGYEMKSRYYSYYGGNSLLIYIRWTFTHFNLKWRWVFIAFVWLTNASF